LIRIFHPAIFLFAAQCFGQVKIVLAQPAFFPQERVRATIVNQSKDTIAYCIHEFGQTPPHNDQVESTFLPFQVQAPGSRTWKRLFIKPWGTLLGSDVAIKSKDELRPGESREFQFWLRDGTKEKFRLVLDYWSAPNPNVCSAGKGGRRAVSKSFISRPDAEIWDQKSKSLRGRRSAAKTPPRKEKQKGHSGERRSSAGHCTFFGSLTYVVLLTAGTFQGKCKFFKIFHPA
jgi:hypothetical protein